MAKKGWRVLPAVEGFRPLGIACFKCGHFLDQQPIVDMMQP